MTSDEQLQAHVEKVIASDGVDDSRAVEVMARALAWSNEGKWQQNRPMEEREWRVNFVWQDYIDDARAALGALRALEGDV